MSETYLTTSQAAKRMNLSSAAIRALIEAGQLPNAKKEGRIWKIPLSDVDAFLSSQASTPTHTPTRWEQLQKHPYIFWPTLVLGSLASIFLFLFALISAGADIGPAADMARQIGWLPTLTSTPTSTPLPTITPLPTPPSTPLPITPREDDEILVVIATFFSAGEDSTLPHREIRDAIQEQAEIAGINNIRVEILPDILTRDDLEMAEILGGLYDASMIIWGDQTSLKIVVNFLSLEDLTVSAQDVTIQETERVQRSSVPDAYRQYILEDLPSQATFLSLYAISQISIWENDYDQALTTIKIAIDVLENVLQLPEGADSAYYNLGWLILQNGMGDLDLAIESYTKSIDLNEIAESYNNRALAYRVKKEYEAAVADYTQAISLNSDFAEAYNNRAVVYDILGMSDLAINDYTQAITINPDYAAAYYNRGLLYSNLENYPLAIADYTQAIEIDPTLIAAYNMRGLAYNSQEEFSTAIADFSQAIEINSNYEFAYNNRGNSYYYMQDYENAIVDYTQAIEIDPTYVFAYLNRGNVYFEQKDYGAAISDYTQASEIQPTFAPAYTKRALVYYGQGEYEAALADYNQAIEIDPSLATIYNNRGLVYFAIGLYDAAINDYTEAIRLEHPDLVSVYNNRGNALSNEGSFDSALSDYTQAITLNSNFIDAYVGRGVIYGIQERYELAIADFNQAIEIDSNYALAYSNRGYTYELQKNYQLSISDYETYLELAPNASDRTIIENAISTMKAELGDD